MKYRLQFLALFAIGVIVALSARGLAQKKESTKLAMVGDVSGYLAAPATPALPSDNAAAAGAAEAPVLEGRSVSALKPAFYRIANDLAPELDIESAVIADVQSGEKYLDNKSAKRWPTASLTKLMTAVVVYEKLDLDSKITLEAADFADGDNPIFAVGETYKARDLLKAMLVASRNTAANALARAAGYDAFIARMNDKAKEWGMDNSNFADPSGLSVVNQSSAGDLLKLIKGVSLERPDIWKTTENASISIKDTETGKVKSFTSTHQFVSRKDFYGGKTGYTPEADGNLVTVFLYGKRTLAIIVLGSQDRFGDTQKLFDWFSNDFKPSN